MGWEDKFGTWAKPPSQSEVEKCENAVRMIKDAIAEDPELSKMEIDVFAQGSYAARTNVRQDSDVDVCVCLRSTIFYDLPKGANPKDYGITPGGSMSFADFRNKVERALKAKFGVAGVTRGNKAFDVHQNTYRVDADVVATFEYQRYDSTPTAGCHRGTKFIADDGSQIINWPQQNYDNGVRKNEATSKQYKAIIRILKNLRNEMQDKGISEADNVASFLIECLVWNAPNECFRYDTYKEEVRCVLAHLFNQTMQDATCTEWGEVNELKYLFRSGQPWTRQQAHAFLSAAWDYLGLV
jgi:hypothetical protein